MLRFRRWISALQCWNDVANAVTNEELSGFAVRPKAHVVPTFGEIEEGRRSSSNRLLGRATTGLSTLFAKLQGPSGAGGVLASSREDVLEDDERGFVRIERGQVLAAGRYYCLKAVGRGTFADVWEVRDCWNGGRRVALKVCKVGCEAVGVQEACVLSYLNSADPAGNVPVVRLLDYFWLDGGTHFCLVQQLLGETLRSYVERQTERLPMSTIRKVCVQALGALVFLRRMGVLHVDLKLENMLLELDSRAGRKRDDELKPEDVSLSNGGPRRLALRLVDFGNAMWLSTVRERISRGTLLWDVQSVGYRAPEVALQRGLGPPAEMWSLGICLCELYRGSALFQALSSSELLEQMEVVFGVSPRHYPRTRERDVVSVELARSPDGSSVRRRRRKISWSRELWDAADADGDVAQDDSFQRDNDIGDCVHVLVPSLTPLGRRETDRLSVDETKLRRLGVGLCCSDTAFLELLCGLLCYDPEQRLSPVEALGSEFLAPLFPFGIALSEQRTR